jgi:hypothetical protein
MTTPSGAHAAPNGRHSAIASTLRIVGAVVAILPLIYFIIQVGENKQRIAHLEARMSEEIFKADGVHLLIEGRTDAKLAQQRELILAELRGISTELRTINQRLERLESRRPND